MTERKKTTGPPPFPEMSFEEALARLLQTDPAELREEKRRAEEEVREIDAYVEERKESIRKGARRTKHRFRL
jgi:hypothetical protein